MTTSQNDPSKCLSGILRQLLCTGSLPTHPSESISTEPNIITNPEKHSKLEEVIKPQAPPTPGIVARLMGLDTLPDFNPAQNRRTLDSMLRSRSVNSVNCLAELDLTQFNHRRVRTSVSFREENATFLQQRESDFVVFRFEKVGSSKWGFSGGKSEMGLEERKLGKVETDRKRGDLGERKFHKKKVVSEREKGKNYRANRRFSSKVDNVNSPYKSIYEMGLEELVEKEVETERNRGDSGDGDIQKKKKKEVVGEREKEKNYRVNQTFSSKVDGVNLPYTSISDMKLKQSEVVETIRNLGGRKLEKKKVSERKGGPNGVCGKCLPNADKVDLIGKKKVVRGKSHETLKGKSAVKTLNHKEILVVVPKYWKKEKSICRHKAKKVKPVCNSKNSSPVSVLDLHNVLRHTETASSDFFKKPKKTSEALEYYHSEVLSEIFRLTEEGIEESKWTGEKVLNFEEVEEICIDLGHQILDLLLRQVIHEQIDSKCMTCMP
ncbi:hypothetical protein RHMOL_Rhmol04G0215600 [Rhododendron molle]|uniref:Uncharacterized protein n=1 Tax=Rhododendron molle TaxID=49168 RepID=A0ACC0P464_RHOML|nr:hypothetical protein RHMOL_Rhmol04G0215600 [Rhododendron molle]